MLNKIDQKINLENYDNLKYDTYLKGILKFYINNSIEDLKAMMKTLINDMKGISDSQF